MFYLGKINLIDRFHVKGITLIQRIDIVKDQMRCSVCETTLLYASYLVDADVRSIVSIIYVEVNSPLYDPLSSSLSRLQSKFLLQELKKVPFQCLLDNDKEGYCP